MQKRVYLVSPTVYEETISLPMIKFNLLPQTLSFKDYDLLLFTSKQAVLSSEKINPHWKEIPCLAIGSATAKQIEDLGGTIAYCPENFYAKELSQDIVTYFKGERILYLRPKEVSFDAKGFLEKEGVWIDERIIYETSCVEYIEKDKPCKNAIIIFTSPSSIHCFLKNFDWDESYTAIVIGEATKKYLPMDARYEVAERALIESCIEKAKSVAGEKTQP